MHAPTLCQRFFVLEFFTIHTTTLTLLLFFVRVGAAALSLFPFEMDIIRKIKPLKATFENLSIRHKLTLLLVLVSFATLLLPHKSYAVFEKPKKVTRLIFVRGDYQDFLTQKSQVLTQKYHQDQLTKEALRQENLNLRLKSYLAKQGSPLANYSKVLVSVKNWKKIVALANAESSLCRKYPKGLGNCWGVGGAELWDMGDDLGEGIIKMNKFLNNSPVKSKIKYAQMSFKQMNGLYKQPAAEHWVYNNEKIYQDLVEIEKSI